MFNTSSMIDKLCENLYEYIRDKVLQDKVGPRYVPNWYRYTFGVIYSLILITGVIGNFCICLVIGTNKQMHRSTNLYLFSLAISDIMILLFGLTVELIQSQSQLYPWKYGVHFCHLRILMLEITPIASVLTITAFSIERYVAICHPMKAHVISSRKRTYTVIGISWFIALIFSLPISAMSKYEHVALFPKDTVKYVQNLTINSTICITSELNTKPHWYIPGEQIPQSLSCFPDMNIPEFSILLKIIAIMFFVVPMVLILILYILIAKKLFITSLLTNNLKNSKSLKSRKSVTRMLAVVVISFFSCWAPYHLQRIIIINGAPSIYSSTFLLILFYVSGSLLYVSSTINPIIYNLMSARFRQAFYYTFRKIIFCCLKKTHWPSSLEVAFRIQQEKTYVSYQSGSKQNIYPIKTTKFPSKFRKSSSFLEVKSPNSVFRYPSLDSLNGGKFVDNENLSLSTNNCRNNKIKCSKTCSNVIAFCQNKKINLKQKHIKYHNQCQTRNTLDNVPIINTPFVDDKI